MKQRNLMCVGNSLSIPDEKIGLSIQAEISPDVMLEWIADPYNKSDEYLGMITLIRSNKRWVIADNLPESACQSLFDSLLDSYIASGYAPIVTYCSFD